MPITRKSSAPLDRTAFRATLRRLPATLLRAKGVLVFADRPDERAVFQLVGVRVPQRGDKKTLQETVARNAKQAMALHKTRRASDLTSRNQALEFKRGIHLAEMSDYLKELPHDATSGDVYAVLDR